MKNCLLTTISSPVWRRVVYMGTYFVSVAVRASVTARIELVFSQMTRQGWKVRCMTYSYLRSEISAGYRMYPTCICISGATTTTLLSHLLDRSCSYYKHDLTNNILTQTAVGLLALSRILKITKLAGKKCHKDLIQLPWCPCQWFGGKMQPTLVTTWASATRPSTAFQVGEQISRLSWNLLLVTSWLRGWHPLLGGIKTTGMAPHLAGIKTAGMASISPSIE